MITWLIRFMQPSFGGGGGGADASIRQQQEDEQRKAELISRVNGIYDSPDAAPRFAAEEGELSDALRGQYGETQRKGYADAEKALRFRAANTGQIGGSEYANDQTKLEEANKLVGTNIEEAVRRAITNLRASREDTRANAIRAVQAGTGEDAVRSAQSGIQSSIDTARATGKEDIIAGAFNDFAANQAVANGASGDSRLLSFFQNRRNSLTPGAAASGGGRIVQ